MINDNGGYENHPSNVEMNDNAMLNDNDEATEGSPNNEVQIDAPHVPETSGGDMDDDELGRGKRQRQTLVLLRDFVTNTIQKLSPSTCSSKPHHPPSESYSIPSLVNSDKYTAQYKHFLAVEAIREPNTFVKATKEYC